MERAAWEGSHRALASLINQLSVGGGGGGGGMRHVSRSTAERLGWLQTLILGGNGYGNTLQDTPWLLKTQEHEALLLTEYM